MEKYQRKKRTQRDYSPSLQIVSCAVIFHFYIPEETVKHNDNSGTWRYPSVKMGAELRSLPPEEKLHAVRNKITKISETDLLIEKNNSEEMECDSTWRRYRLRLNK